MKTFFTNTTLRMKLLASFGFILLVLCAQGINNLSNLSSVNGKIKTVAHEIQPALLASMNLSEEVKKASKSLGFYLLSKEESHLTSYETSIAEMNEILGSLSKSEVIGGVENGNKIISELTEYIRIFSSYRDQVNKLVTVEGENLIAIKYASENINPLAMEISQLLSQAIIAEDDEDATELRKEILTDLNNLRYAWSSLINEMRLFLAFRAPAAKENMAMYLEKMDSVAAQVIKHGDELTFEQADAIEQVESLFAKYKGNLEVLVSMHESDKWRVDSWLIRTEINPLLDSINEDINELTGQLEAKSRSATAAVNAMYIKERNRTVLGTGIIFAIISALCWLLIRNITRPLARAVGFANAISEGDLSGKIDAGSADETGQLLNALQSMQFNLKARIETDQKNAAVNSRIRQSLDSVNTNVMNVDQNKDITFINQSLNELLHRKQNEFKQDLHNFDAEKLIGENLDALFKDHDLQDILATLSECHIQEFYIGDTTLEITFNPVMDQEGNRIGTSMEWNDRTQEVAIEEEIKDIVDASLSGDLSQRIDLSNKAGFFEMLSQGINDLVDVSERAINDTVSVLGAMAHGDLSRSIEADYEGSFGQLKNDTNSTIAKLTEVLGKISTNADEVLNGAHEIAQGNTNLSQRTEEQAASLEETASSMEEMTSTVRQNADNARTANQLALGAREQAEKGGSVVSNAVSAMSEITTSSKKISDIIGVIDEIAFQTNLLALNAAVEAARAGEQGRGFAVVASEVRNLAGRSATAAKEIKELIQDSVVKVEEGSKLVDESGQTLEEIMNSVKKVSDIIGEIAAAGEEQSAGIEQVNKAISQMDEMTQQNAALVEEAAASSEAMGEQARSLNELVGFFTTSDTARSKKPATERRSGERPWEKIPAVKPKTIGNSTMDFSAARTKHLSWKTRLRSFLDGKESMTEDQAVSHHECDLGKWLYSTGLAQYGHYSEMKVLEKIHAELHSIIKDVVSLKNEGDAGMAESRFSRVEPVSQRIIGLLDAVEARLKGTTAKPQPVANTLKMATGDSEWEEF